MSTPSAQHPFRVQSTFWNISKRRSRGWKHHGEWRCTHLLVYEDDKLAELYRWRGAYYTLEQYSNGEPGYTRKDLREGESIESAYASREENE